MAASPQPLPEPTPAPGQGALSVMLESAAAAAGPNVPAEVTAGVAQNSATPQDAVTGVQAAGQYLNTAQAVQELQGQSHANQSAFWKELPADQQAQFRAAGYKPPSSGGGFGFGSILHAVGTGLHDTMNAAGAGLRFGEHVERTVLSLADEAQRAAGDTSGASAGQGNDLGKGLAGWGHLFTDVLSPGEWAKNWNQTEHGEKYVLPEVENKVYKQYGPDTYSLALKLATGTTPQQILQATPAAQQQALAVQLNSDPNLHKAVQELQNGKLSVGRMLVGEHFMTSHPLAGRILSGGTDALMGWFGDPTVVGAKLGKTATVARYLVRNGDDVAKLYDTLPSVQKAFADLAHLVAARDTSGILERYPYLAPVVDRLYGEEADTADKLRTYFSNEANVSAIVQGNAAHVGELSGGIIPHLTYAGQARLAAKGALTKAIDWAADRPATIDGLNPGDVIDHPLNPQGPITRLTTGAGRFVRQATTLIPRSHTFDPFDKGAVATLHDVALMALPRARADFIVNKFFATPDLGEKRKIYFGLMKELGHAAGWDASPDMWKNYLSRFTSESADGIAQERRYAPGIIDRFDSNGQPTSVGVLEQHMTHEWAIPDFLDLYANGKKASMTRATVGAINAQGLNRFMDVWRKLVLTRPGFALRFAGEEAFGFLLREGPLAYARSRLALSALKNSSDHRMWMAHQLGDEETAGLWDRLTGHLPEAVKQKITDPVELVAQTVGDAAHRGMSKVEGALAGERYVGAARWLAQHGELDPDKIAASHVFAGEGHGMGAVDSDLRGANKASAVMNGRIYQAELKGTGKWSEYRPGDPLYLHMWNKQLREIAQSDWAREALWTRDQPFAARQDAVAQRIKANPEMWSRSIRHLGTRDGRLVANGDATLHEAAMDHAQAVIDLVDSATRTPSGEHIPGLADHLLEHSRPPTVPVLSELDDALRPLHVKGPETLGVLQKPSLMGKLTDRVWDQQIGPMMNWISRQPMMLHHYALSRDLAAAHFNQMGDTLSAQNMEDLVHQWSYDRALSMTVPFIHNPALKSEFSSVTRNLSPFWFAQEQFYKRWARTAKYAPWAFRQAQLINMGVKHSGFVHTDPETGHEYFVYPGSAITTDVLSKTLSAFGVKSQLPIEGALIGQVNQMSPGLERLGVPSFSPFVVAPLNELKTLDPAFTGAVNKLEGPQSASSGLLKALLPTTITRIIDAADPSAIDASQYASAQMQAIQYLEATGHGVGQTAINNRGTYNEVGHPPASLGTFKSGDYVTDAAGKKWVVQADGSWKVDDGTSQQQYLARVQNWTRILLATRLIFGFSGPASPELQFNPNHLHDDLQTYLQQLPFNEALQAFMTQHPNANAYTVFQTKTASGDPLPATAAAMSYMDANAGFMTDHSLAGPFFIPQADTTGKFDLAAYQQQMAEGLRQRKDPATYWKEAVYDAAAGPYFQKEDLKNLMVANPAAYGVTRTQVENDWTQWSAQYFDANPVFADYLQSSNGSLMRQQVMEDVGNALRDPRLAESPQVEDIRTVYNAWVAYQSTVGNYGSPNTPRMSANQVQRFQEQFALQGTQFVAAHPDVANLWNRAIRPGLTTALNLIAQGGQ